MIWPHRRVAIAASNAASGSATPSDLPPPRGVPSGSRIPLWRASKWLGGGVILALAGGTAWQVAQHGFDRLFHDHPPAIEAQVRGVLGEAAERGFRATSNRLIDLDGDGTTSRLIVLRMVEQKRRTGRSSDELRIYDVEGSRLKLTFRFRPLAPRLPAGPLPDPGPPFDLQLTDARDLDGNGTVEPILQAIEHVGRDPNQGSPRIRSFTRPLMLVWDFGRERYDVVSLLDPEDTPDDWSVGASAVDAIAVRRSQDGPLLADAVSQDKVGHVDDPFELHTYRVRIWHLYPDGLGTATQKCRTESERVEGITATLAIDEALTRPRMC